MGGALVATPLGILKEVEKIMKTYKLLFFVIVFVTINLFSQHLPLQIGNQWHYAFNGIGFNQVAIATDTVRINGFKYYKINYWNMGGLPFNGYYYDRMEGDSSYYRYHSSGEDFLFNFNWTDGAIVNIIFYDSCAQFNLILRSPSTYLGVQTDIYNKFGGDYCPGYPDTNWTLSSLDYSDFFGEIRAGSGTLIGAYINGISYGTLYPVPVELFSFTASVVNRNIHLNWITATETNNYGFEIFRYFLTDSVDKQYLGFVKGNGTTSEINSYEFEDKNLSSGNYKYVLIQIDYDGTRKEIAETEIYIDYPNSYKLHQNYPNPFNPTTTIKYSIPQNDFVNLTVYNILGKAIKTLVNEEKPAGGYEVNFDASYLSSGVYLYKIQAGNYTKVNKLMLLK